VQLRRVLFLVSVMLVASAPMARAAFHVEGVNEVTFTWEPASGPVASYAVHVARNGDPEALYSRVPDTQVVVGGQPGDTVVVRVVAEDGDGNQGPFSPASEPLLFADPAPPPDPPPGDLDGDGAADIVLRDPHTGENALYALDVDVLRPLGTLPAKDLDWKLALTGDLDGNGASDLVWIYDKGSVLEFWLLDAGTLVGGGVLRSGPGWTPEQTVDANGDGLSDLWLRDAKHEALELWLMDGLEELAALPVAGYGADWKLVSARDFDGDGASDLLWHNPSLGRLELWRMDGATRLETVVVDESLAGDWTALGAADFDGDGLADALLESRGLGRVAVRSPYASAPVLELAAPDAADRELLTTGDFDGDGQEEALWRNRDTSTLDFWRVSAAGIDTLALDDPMAFDAPAATGCAGDLDGDGWIGLADLSALGACFGQAATGDCAAADLTGDGRIGGPDYSALRKIMGDACTSE
jgi:hypothetical protein